VNDDIGQNLSATSRSSSSSCAQPDDAHSAAPKDFDERVTAEKFLPEFVFAQRHLPDVARALVSYIPGVQCGFSSQSS
jgi:hypothetical protein